MVILTVVMIGIALSADAFAVAVTSGAIFKKFKIHHALRIAAFFGAFQAIMPIMGYLAGVGLRNYISNYDHWIAFALLAIVGGKMIIESMRGKNEPNGSFDPSKLMVIFTLAIATSIDALAVGVTISLLAMPIAVSVLIIGFITFCLSFAGVYAGARVGHFFEKRIEMAGGVILILIGLKILADHLK